MTSNRCTISFLFLYRIFLHGLFLVARNLSVLNRRKKLVFMDVVFNMVISLIKCTYLSYRAIGMFENKLAFMQSNI